jgi:hypothetical protein
VQAGALAIGSTARVTTPTEMLGEHAEHDLMAASDAQLLIDVLQVEPYRARREPKPLGNLPTIEIAQEAADDIALSGG